MPPQDTHRTPYKAYGTCALCTRPVRHWSRHCNKHQRALREHGHPRARPIPGKELIHWAAMALRVIDRNPDHDGLKTALAELQNALDVVSAQASAGAKLTAAQVLMLELIRSKVTPKDILVMSAAAVLYETFSNDPALNAQAYAHRVARSCLALVSPKPKGRRRAATPMRAFGQAILDDFGSLLAAIVAAVRVERQARELREQALGAPLK